MRKRKQSLIIGIILLVLALGIGYAYLNTTLNISGTTNVDANSWNVYWDNVVVTNGSVTAEDPEIDTNKTTVSFAIHLEKPGDFYEFTVDAKNDGSMDAMIESVTKIINNSTTIPTYLKYEVTYDNGIAIEETQELKANTKETYKVRIEYKKDINSSDLPATPQSLTVSFSADYIQADDRATLVPEVIYVVSGSTFIGNTVPTTMTTYSNYQDATTAFGYPFFLRHYVSNNIITETYVGFILNGNVYYLRGGVNERNLSTKPVYESNKEVLKNAYGEENCYGSDTNYNCSISGLNVYSVVYNSGNVNVHNIYMGCHIDSTNAACGRQ